MFRYLLDDGKIVTLSTWW